MDSVLLVLTSEKARRDRATHEELASTTNVRVELAMEDDIVAFRALSVGGNTSASRVAAKSYVESCQRAHVTS